MPEFESAIIGTYPSRPDAAITLADESATTKTLVRSDRTQFGVGFGASRTHGQALVCGTRPDEWLVLGPAAAVQAAEAAVDRDGFTNVIPFTHGRALFRLTGDRAPELLGKICGIDWSDTMTPPGAVVGASVALVTCDIIRHDLDAGRSYLIQCDRSFGQYLFDAILDAGDEFGIGVVA